MRAAAAKQPQTTAAPAPTAAPPPKDSGAGAPAWYAIARGVAFFLGIFALLNLAGELRTPGFDANLWWIDLRPVPAPVARGLLALTGLLLAVFALKPDFPDPLRRVAVLLTIALFAVALWNVFGYYTLLKQGAIHTDFPLPFSLHVAACLAIVAAGLMADPAPSDLPGRDGLLVVATVVACAIAFPLAQMACFGKTDYRREAEVAVVFGCRTYRDGRPSEALADRVQTGCELYQEGLVDRIILSGGPGDGEVHETEAMRDLAIELGVPADRILLDRQGLDTQSTVNNTAPHFRKERLRTVLAVSHSYHLPRIKLCYRRAGIDVLTVPARQQRPLERQERLLMREVAALWLYYARPLAR